MIVSNATCGVNGNTAESCAMASPGRPARFLSPALFQNRVERNNPALFAPDLHCETGVGRPDPADRLDLPEGDREPSDGRGQALPVKSQYAGPMLKMPCSSSETITPGIPLKEQILSANPGIRGIWPRPSLPSHFIRRPRR